MNSYKIGLCSTLLSLTLVLSGCMSVAGDSALEQRHTILDMEKATLSELYKKQPSVKESIKNSPGYAVFSNDNINIIFASFSGGYGVAQNNTTKKVTYMKMSGLGIGLGLGAKDYRLVMVFHKAKAFKTFVDTGWVFGAQADAAAKAEKKGGAASSQGSIGDVTTYVFTKAGLSLQATIEGTKYWKDADLN